MKKSDIIKGIKEHVNGNTEVVLDDPWCGACTNPIHVVGFSEKDLIDNLYTEGYRERDYEEMIFLVCPDCVVKIDKGEEV